jgi:alpha/beta superfamily hydrolase
VVCHPHPLYGGTMTNKVVHTLARSLQEQGMPTVRFNYRGVGKSAGQYDEGRGETADALAVVAWGRERWPGVPLTLAGFSFGAMVALLAAPAAQPVRSRLALRHRRYCACYRASIISSMGTCPSCAKRCCSAEPPRCCVARSLPEKQQARQVRPCRACLC